MRPAIGSERRRYDGPVAAGTQGASMRVFAAVLAVVMTLCGAPFCVAKPRPAATKASQPVQVTPSLLRGKIIFLRGDDVWMVDPQTRRERMIYRNLIQDGQALNAGSSDGCMLSFSHDRKYVAYKHPSENFIGSDLYLLDVEHNVRSRLIESKPEDEILEPRFSPDGKKIVYTHLTGYHMPPGFASMEIRIVNADGSNDHAVINGNPPKSQSYFNAYWSRDGKRLLFIHRSSNAETYEDLRNGEFQTCAVNGSHVEKFDGNYSDFLMPDFSPDFKLRVIAGAVNVKSEYHHSLKLYSSEGHLIRLLVTASDFIHVGRPEWSADGKHIVFEAAQTRTQIDNTGRVHSIAQSGIWSIGIDGHDLRRITANASLVAVL
jgi:Tol biopolymer transport system component